MADVCCPQYLPFSPNHAPCPPCVSPEIYIALVVAAPVAVIFWFWRNLHRPLLELEQLPDEGGDQIPAIPEDLDAPTVGSSIAPPQAEATYRSPSDGSGPSRASDEEDDDKAGRAELAPAFINATVDRSCVVAGILDKMSNAFRGIFLDVHNSDESTIHPANGVLMEFLCGNTDAVLSIFGSGDSAIEHYSAMFDCWVSKLEEEGERIFQGEKGRMHIFLLNNAYDVLQMMRCRGASFSKLISVIQRYKKGYFDECWVPLINPCRLDKFTSVCNRQMTWKVTAELRYTLQQEIVDLILPPYEISLLAHKANQSPLSEILYWLKRLMAGKKKQKKLTVEALEKVIKDLFEG